MTSDFGFREIAEEIAASVCVARGHLGDESCEGCNLESRRIARHVIPIVMDAIVGDLSRLVALAADERRGREVADVNEAVHNAAVVAGMTIAYHAINEYGRESVSQLLA